MSTKYSTIIDPAKQKISDSFILFWIRINQVTVDYRHLDKISVSNQRRGYTANSRSRDRQVKFNEYVGNLLYEEGKSFELSRSVNFESFSERLRNVAESLDIPLEWDH